MKTLMKIGMLALPLLFAGACGGLDMVDGGDGGTPVCGGATLYRVATGTYTSTSVTGISDTCNSPMVTAAQLMGMRKVNNDTTTGTVTLFSTDGVTELGHGDVRCNAGSLTFSGMLQTGNCQYQSDRTVQLTVTADNKLTFTFTDNRTQFTSSGGTCTMTQPCSISYTMSEGM